MLYPVVRVGRLLRGLLALLLADLFLAVGAWRRRRLCGQLDSRVELVLPAVRVVVVVHASVGVVVQLAVLGTEDKDCLVWVNENTCQSNYH